MTSDNKRSEKYWQMIDACAADGKREPEDLAAVALQGIGFIIELMEEDIPVAIQKVVAIPTKELPAGPLGNQGE